MLNGDVFEIAFLARRDTVEQVIELQLPVQLIARAIGDEAFEPAAFIRDRPQILTDHRHAGILEGFGQALRIGIVQSDALVRSFGKEC